MPKSKFGFEIRAAVCLITVFTMFLAGIGMLFKINSSEFIKTSLENNVYNIEICRQRKNIFDCNKEKITGIQEDIYAVISPCEQGIMYVASEFFGEEKKNLLKTLEAGKPVKVKVKNETEIEGVTFIRVSRHLSPDTVCPQLIGYTDDAFHGVYGLEKLFDNELYTDKYVSVKYPSFADGTILSGEEVKIVYDKSVENSGVVTTIDMNIQLALGRATEKMTTGAAVISEIETGKIRGVVSKPDFDVTCVADYLNDENSPFLNRALTGYNVGSVFKPLVAAVLYENGLDTSFSYECKGNTSIDGHTFYCHNKSGHGKMTVESAIIKSCNTFFYNLGVYLKGQRIYDLATVFGFGKSEKIFEGIKTTNESITEREMLNTFLGETANLAIGQGKLLASPVKMLNLYSAVANGGVYCSPTLIEGIMENGSITKSYAETRKTRAISENTSRILRKYLEEVVLSGTGTAAKPKYTTAAGKTATAQTGIYKDGKEIEHSWFCGYFPADNPEYAVAVIVENAGDEDMHGADFFALIADKVTCSK